MTTEISRQDQPSMDRRGALKALFGFVAVAAGASIVFGAGEAAAAPAAPAVPQPAAEPAKADMASDEALPESVETQYYYRRRVVRRVYRRPVYRRRVYRPVYRARPVYRRRVYRSRPRFMIRF